MKKQILIDKEHFFMVFSQSVHRPKCNRIGGADNCTCGLWKSLGKIEEHVNYSDKQGI